MHPVLEKTFGGLSVQYYFRHFVFGLIFFGIIAYASAHGEGPARYSMVVFALVNTLLYPYSRYVYESIVGFVMGGNVFFVNAIFMIMVKLMTMAMCWSLALFIAPVGLIFLYFQNSRAA